MARPPTLGRAEQVGRDVSRDLEVPAQRPFEDGNRHDNAGRHGEPMGGQAGKRGRLATGDVVIGCRGQRQHRGCPGVVVVMAGTS